jgi:hypothetical protein
MEKMAMRALRLQDKKKKLSGKVRVFGFDMLIHVPSCS